MCYIRLGDRGYEGEHRAAKKECWNVRIRRCLLVSVGRDAFFFFYLNVYYYRRFTIPCARKILHQVDVDGDKKLDLLDLLSIFYVTDIYLKSMAGKLFKT